MTWFRGMIFFINLVKNFGMSENSTKAVYIHGSKPKEQERLSKLNDLLNQRCLAAIELKKGNHILDVGSGLGQFSYAMAKKMANTGIVIGVERAEAQLKKAAHYNKTAYQPQNIKFRKGSAYNLPLTPEEWNSFDLVHSRFLLEHLAAPQKAVNQMVKAAKVGGRIILCDDDHSTFRPTPEPLGFSLLWTAYCRSYERIGNDPYIGSRLVSLLHHAGVTKIRNSSIFFGGCQGDGHFDLVSDNLIGIIESAKDLIIKEQLLNEKTFNSALESLRDWAKLPDAALHYSIDWVEGVKAKS